MARPTAAFFDLDKTIIAKSSTLAFSKPFQAGGLISRRAVLRARTPSSSTSSAAPTTTRWRRCGRSCPQLCAGWDVATVREIVADTLHNIVDPLVYDEAVSLIEEHRLAGRDVVIVSTSGSEVVEPIGEMLGADRVDRHPDGDRRRPVHRRDRVLRVRRGEGARDPRARRAASATTSSAATPTATRSPTCPCSRRSATRTPSTPTRSCAGSRPPQRLAGAGVHQAGRAAQPGAAARRPSRRWPRWPSAARGRRRAVAVGQRRRRQASRGGLSRTSTGAPKSTLEVSPRTGVQRRHNNSKPAREPGTHAAIYPSYRALPSGHARGSS